MLDEPTAGLDPGGRDEMVNLIQRTGREFGISVILSSHLMGDVERTCDRVIVLEAGQVVTRGEVSDLTQETESVFIEVEDHRDELMAALERRSIPIATDGAALVAEVGAEEQYDAIRDALVESNARLRRLAPPAPHAHRDIPESRPVTELQAELYDIGYQHYEGPREGRLRAARAVWTSGVRTALGLGRPLMAKVFPWLFFLFAILMAMVMTIIITLGGDLTEVPGASGYYQLVSFLLILYGAVVAPELLCPDRRDGVISLYLVRPLTPTDYVAARWLAFFAVTLTYSVRRPDDFVRRLHPRRRGAVGLSA